MRDILSNGQLSKAWFQQDGAPPHTAHALIEFLNELFPGRLIALGSQYEWAPHSPDLNPLDFWLWGATKDEVYKSRPETLEQLKQKVTDYVKQISPVTWKMVGEIFRIRIAACHRRRGAHIEHVSYHKLVDF